MPQRAPEPTLASRVTFLFGVADREMLPGPPLVQLITDCGATPSAARSVLARMRRSGALAGRRRGRTTEYALAGPALLGFQRARDTGRAHEAASAPWSGSFHALLISVPERHRRHRDQLRTAAILVGYMPLRPGLMISATDAWPALADTVAALPAAATAYPARIELNPADARAAAAEAWHLDEIAVETRRLARRLEDAATGAPLAEAPETLRGYVDAAMPAYYHFITVPQLPAELLPDDWPLPRLVAALGEVGRRFAPGAEAYVRSVLGAA